MQVEEVEGGEYKVLVMLVNVPDVNGCLFIHTATLTPTTISTTSAKDTAGGRAN